MEYQEFIRQVRKQVEAHAGSDVRVDVNRILKNNREPADGLTILHRGENVARAIWLKPLYQRYEYGVPVSRIAEEILEYHERTRDVGRCDLSFYTNFERVKSRIACRLIHRDLNQELLQSVPHRDFLDLSVVYYYKMEAEGFGNASILVKNDHLRIWHVDQEIIHMYAMRNTQRLLPYEFMDMVELIEQMMDEALKAEAATEFLYHQEIPMYVLTNKEKTFGAANILFPSVLREVGEKMKSDYYILPSSIHECIVVPALEGMDPKNLHEMVAEINREHVAREELLGDSVYRYERETESLIVAYGW